MNFQGFFFFFSGLILFSTNPSHAEPTPLTSSSKSVLLDRIEAIVNKKAIFRSDLKKFKALSPLRSKVDPLFANDPLSKKIPTDPEITQFLIAETLILEQFPVSDQELDQELNSIQSNLKISREALKEAISREGYQFEDYRQLMRASIAKRQLIDRDIRNKAAVSEDELKSEYNRTRSGSKTFSGTVHLHLIKITKKNYQSVKNARDLYDEALKLLASGSPFEEVAKKTSDDSSATSGGDLGFLSYQDMNSSLQKEVRTFLSVKDSDRSPIGKFEDAQSFVIYRISEISKDVDSGFEKEKDPIRAKLLEREFQHQIQLWIDRQRSLNFIQVNAG